MFQFIFVEPNLSLDTIADISNMYLHYLITTNKRKVGYEKLRCKDEKGIVIYLHPFLAKLSKIHYEAGDEFFYVRNKNNTEFSAEYEEVTKEDYTWEVKFLYPKDTMNNLIQFNRHKVIETENLDKLITEFKERGLKEGKDYFVYYVDKVAKGVTLSPIGETDDIYKFVSNFLSNR